MRPKSHWLAGLALSVAAVSCAADAQVVPANSTFAQRIAAFESEYGGRLGVAALNTANSERVDYREAERFAMCSTFKLLLAAAVLSRIDAGDEALERQIPFSAKDIESYAPIVSKHLSDGQMSVAELSAAAIEYSDNTAANLLLASIGGPAGLTGYLRSLGDKITRLDRNEPELNTNIQDDARDTTTPGAMLASMQKVLVGDALSSASREQLVRWLIGNTTGDARLRAGFNAAWTVGDKTGSGQRGASNDVAIIWPPGKMPILLAVYYSGSSASPEQRNAVIAKTGRMVREAFYPH